MSEYGRHVINITVKCLLLPLLALTALIPTAMAQVSFAPLPYSDPFPPTTVLGTPAQAPESIVFQQSFAEQTSGNGVLNNCLASRRTPLTYPVPTALQTSVKALSVEVWVKIPSDRKGQWNVLSGPGFSINANWSFDDTPNGTLWGSFAVGTQDGYVQSESFVTGLKGDGQWHQYVFTCDAHNVVCYVDGEQVGQTWFSNHPDRIGPMISPNGIQNITNNGVPDVISAGGIDSASIDELRVSTVVLTPQQVRQNYESYRSYGATYYVSPKGSASNPGTQTRPLDLATALNRTGSRTRLILLPGTYNGSAFNLVNRTASSPLDHCLIMGLPGNAQAIINTSGNTITSVKNLTLRNLSFRAGARSALTIRSSSGVLVESCRFSSLERGLLIDQSSGNPGRRNSRQLNRAPGVTVQNCVFAASTIGIHLTNSSVCLVRNNTLVNGTIGLKAEGNSGDLTLKNTLFSNQSDACLNMSATSRPYFSGDGNLYSPKTTGGLAVLGTTRYSSAQLNAYVRDWYTYQYPNGLSHGSPINVRVERHSLNATPTFVSASTGDFRLASTLANGIDAGVPSEMVSDALGGERFAGNSVDIGAYETSASLSAQFLIDSECMTSAGVYAANDTLVRTLWRSRKCAAGPFTVYWNGLDDMGKPVSPGNFSIKLLTHNVKYVWEGAAGNNSRPNTGLGVHASFSPMCSMAINGNNVYYTTGYNEGRSNFYRFDTRSPKQVTASFGRTGANIWDYVQSLALDSGRVYGLTGSILMAYNLGDQSAVTIAGASVNITVGTPNGRLAGIAVQQSGNLLFAAHTGDNRIYLYDKTTFQPARMPFISVTAPTALATTASGDLWVICQDGAGLSQIVRYTGFSSTPVIVQRLSGFSSPLGIAISKVDSSLLVSDGGTSQQIKAFDSNGNLLWTLGQRGGYANGPAITNDKFVLNGLIACQEDGSFWVGDTCAGSRTLHFGANRQYLEQILYVPHTYCAAVDQNNPTRVFNLYTEYRVDYSSPFEEGAGWTPVNYWGYLNGVRLNDGVAERFGSAWIGLANVVTLRNGRTYAMVNSGYTNIFLPGTMQVMELSPNGLRRTGYVTPQWSANWLQPDGSFVWGGPRNKAVSIMRLPLAGFDANNNPQWASVAETTTATSGSPAWDFEEPAPLGMPYYSPYYQLSSTSKIVVYNPSKGGGFHLGMIDPATGQYLWKSCPADGEFDGTGNYDTIAEYAGNRVMTAGGQIICGYNGEFWHGGQANQYIHYSEDGLFIGQFGQPQTFGVMINASGAAGNSFSPSLVSVGSNLYLYHNDESDRGSHRWRIEGLETIKRQTATVFTTKNLSGSK